MKRPVALEWDERKSARNVAQKRPPFEDVVRFDFGAAMIFEDRRKDYGERRMVAISYVDRRLHVLVFTERGGGIRVISFRHANEREIARYARQTLDRIPD